MNFRILGVALGLGAATLANPAAAVTELTFSLWIPWNHPLAQKVYARWVDEVEKATAGSIKIRRLPKAVASPRAHLDAVRTGQADLGFAVHGYSPKRFAAYKFAEFPMLGNSAVSTSVALWRTHKKFFESKDRYRGVQLVGVNMHGPGHIFHRSKQILKPSDMKGQKMRTGGPVPLAIIRAWGGVAVRQPAPKSYEILSTDVADGVTFPYESVESFRLINLVPFATEIDGGLYSSSHFMVMNKKKYDALPAKDKEILAKFMGEGFARLAGEGWDARNKTGREAAVKAGTKIVKAPKEMVDSVKALTAKFEKEYIASVKKDGIDGAAVLQFFRAEVAKLEAK
ncbi:MAG: TRAP transporter substrate-binding protein [Bauldia litoralis]